MLRQLQEAGQGLDPKKAESYEFLSGPVTGPQISAIRAFLSGGISLLAPLPCIPNYEASSFLTN
jgi:hypothetical protein